MTHPAEVQTTSATMALVIRFAIVGLGVAGLYLGLYLLVLELGFARALANGASFGIAVSVQYVAQTRWTFRRSLAAPDQILRFAVAIGLGFVTSMILTAGLAPMLGWPDAWAPIAVMLVLPVQNFVIFRLWVYGTRAQDASG